jgi:hypothetical protein
MAGYGKVPAPTEEELDHDYEYGGDTRTVRDLIFSYTAAVENPDGSTSLTVVDLPRGTEVSTDDLGDDALASGEANHSFYTDEELERMAAGGNPDQPLSVASGGVSEMGEYALAAYIGGENTDTKAMTAQEVVNLAAGDKDLAHRLLQAENIASEGEPRKTVEAGLTAIIEGE